MTKHLVVGFVFDGYNPAPWVLLIQKNRPEWQKGLWNGIGGHVEATDMDGPTESLLVNAMVREFKEETGVTVPPERWVEFAVVDNAPNAMVHFFYAVSPEAHNNYRSMTDEEVRTMPVRSLTHTDCIPNLRYLVPLALNHGADRSGWRLKLPIVFREENIKT